MVKAKPTYQCEVCGSYWETEEEAGVCEERPLTPPFQVGMIFKRSGVEYAMVTESQQEHHDQLVTYIRPNGESVQVQGSEFEPEPIDGIPKKVYGSGDEVHFWSFVQICHNRKHLPFVLIFHTPANFNGDEISSPVVVPLFVDWDMWLERERLAREAREAQAKMLEEQREKAQLELAKKERFKPAAKKKPTTKKKRSTKRKPSKNGKTTQPKAEE